MPPRQKTTFKKGQKKGTTTYREYSPEKERASAQLERFIRDNPEGDRRNTEASPIQDVVRDMPAKFQGKFKGIENYDDMNQAQKALFGFYDNRNKYQRDMNTLRTSSPEMRQAYAKRFPVSNFMMEVAPRYIPGIGALFTADRGMKANAEKERIMNTPVNRPDGGFKNFVEFFKPQMNSEQIANTEIIEGEKEPLINPQDMNIHRAVNPSFASPQDMGFLDSENIFDTEKAAIDAALTPGNVFDPVAADKQSKLNFINQVEGTNFTVENAEQRFNIDEQFERSKQKQGGIIREEVNRDLNVDDEDPIPGGQFNLTSPTVNEDTVPVILGGAGPDYEYGDFMINEDLGNVIPTDNMFPEGGVSGTPVTQAGQGLVFSDGTPVTQPVDTGINTPAGQAAIDILNSNATNDVKRSFVDDNYGMTNPDIFMNDQRFDTIDYGFADGGSTNKYQNMSTHEKLMRMAAEMYG